MSWRGGADKHALLLIQSFPLCLFLLAASLLLWKIIFQKFHKLCSVALFTRHLTLFAACFARRTLSQDIHFMRIWVIKASSPQLLPVSAGGRRSQQWDESEEVKKWWSWDHVGMKTTHQWESFYAKCLLSLHGRVLTSCQLKERVTSDGEHLRKVNRWFKGEKKKLLWYKCEPKKRKIHLVHTLVFFASMLASSCLFWLFFSSLLFSV